MKITEDLRLEDNIRFEKYDIDRVREHVPEWDILPKWMRHWYCRYYIQPVEVGSVHNVTCDGLHDYVALALTLTASDSSDLDPAGEIAFGDDESSFSTSDTSMNNEVGNRINVNDRTRSGKDFNIDEYLSSNEQNGNTLKEIGVFSQDGTMYQHASTPTNYNKDSSFAITINVKITVGDA